MQNPSRYVLHCVHTVDGSTMATALSNYQIKIYDRYTLEPKASSALEGHLGPLTGLCPSPDHPSLLVSSSEDKTVRLWDLRVQSGCVSVIQQVDEALSCAFGKGSGLLAVGVGCHVDFFDARQTKQESKGASGGAQGGSRASGERLGRYADVHTDIVTKVVFHPSQTTTLASASEDGLVCLYDTGVSQADEALACILNAESPVRDITFFGAKGDGLALLTGSEGTSVWHWPSALRALDVEDLRQSAGSFDREKALFSIQYHYDQGTDRLRLALSDVEGSVTVVEVQPGGEMHPILRLESGHKSLVRAVDSHDGTWVTGGEDARLCLWNEKEQEGQVNQSTAFDRKQKKGKKLAPHFQPY